jgi:MFS family permease
MATMTMDESGSSRRMTAEERKVIFASSLGTVFEWYDFYIYGTLGVFLAKYFFSNVPPNVAFIFTLLAFAAGFAVRPLGALVFGRIGDIVGRKYTFLVTMTLMGVGTFFIGVLPSYAQWGIAAPIVLIALRLVQASRSAANMAARRSMSPSMRLPESAATTRRGSRPRRRSVSSWLCC